METYVVVEYFFDGTSTVNRYTNIYDAVEHYEVHVPIVEGGLSECIQLFDPLGQVVCQQYYVKEEENE